jgi:RNA polymerase sigma-70 factor (ECF subfamily)
MDVKQWPQIVRQHSPLVWRTIRRLVTHHDDAADCFQETFVSAWQLSERQAVHNWPALLQHLATARALDSLRRRRHQAKRFLESIDMAEMVNTNRGPPHEIQSAELAAQLRDALAKLPPQHSEAYCLRHLNELPYAQIAETLEMSVGNVGVILHRATERLRQILAPTMDVRQTR